MNDDWRLFREQEKYLYGVTLIKQAYKTNDPFNDHDHCEFCMIKFGEENDELNQGYSTEDCRIWICPQCYFDFKKQFKWRVKTMETGDGSLSPRFKKGKTGNGGVSSI